MAESAIERLKRIAREKEAAKNAVAQVSADSNKSEEKENVVSQSDDGTGYNDSGSLPESPVETPQNSESSGDTSSANISAALETLETVRSVSTGMVSSGPDNSNLPAELETPTPRNHPLSMQFAELESALVAGDPSFKVLLRDIHRHLGMEPELVTMMTEEEVRLVVSGMVHFANAEIVEPAKAKAAKNAVTAAKKKVITEDDL